MNTSLKRILVPALASRPVSKLGTWLFGNGIPVFTLHRMQTNAAPYTGHSPEHLRRCLQYLADEDYQFLSLEDAIQSVKDKKAVPAKSVVFTMDDGFWDQAEIAAPLFLEFDCPVTQFVITGMLDNRLWPWDDKVSYLINTTEQDFLALTLADESLHLPLANENDKREARDIVRNTIKAMAAESIEEVLVQLAQALDTPLPDTPPDYFEPMNWDMARQLEKAGVKFAPHSISHRILAKLDDKSAEQEILGSWKRVKEELHSPSPVFCYPTGRFCDYGTREIDLLRANGFIGAVSTLPGSMVMTNTSRNYLYNLPRYNFPDTFEDFIQCCTWIEHAKSRTDHIT